MSKNLEIAEALAEAGYLQGVDIHTAAELLADALEIEDVEAVRAAIRDKAKQENLIKGASALAENDAQAGDKKALKVDQAIIQDAINQEEVDDAIIYQSEYKLAEACERAAESLAAAGLVDPANVDEAAALIEDAWEMDEG
jgi:hypothetical protein